MSVITRLAVPGDWALTEALVAHCFGPGRFAKSAYRLREGVLPLASLSYVAVDGDRFVGSVQYWPIAIGSTAALLLGPLAVEPALRGQGIGLDLMRISLDTARRLSHRVVILVGDEPYYSKVGFTRIPLGSLVFPGPVNPHRILGLALADGALEGLKGPVLKGRIDDPNCACGVGVAAAEVWPDRSVA